MVFLDEIGMRRAVRCGKSPCKRVSMKLSRAVSAVACERGRNEHVRTNASFVINRIETVPYEKPSSVPVGLMFLSLVLSPLPIHLSCPVVPLIRSHQTRPIQ